SHKSVNFVSTLLQITMSEQLDLPVRQAGVIYLKNMITQYWPDREVTPVKCPPTPSLRRTVTASERTSWRPSSSPRS
ncbi:unnamed protein product, partial [Ranitomeya imitator]